MNTLETIATGVSSGLALNIVWAFLSGKVKVVPGARLLELDRERLKWQEVAQRQSAQLSARDAEAALNTHVAELVEKAITAVKDQAETPSKGHGTR